MRRKYIVVIVGLMALAAIGMGGKVETAEARQARQAQEALASRYANCRAAAASVDPAFVKFARFLDDAAKERVIKNCAENP